MMQAERNVFKTCKCVRERSRGETPAAREVKAVTLRMSRWPWVLNSGSISTGGYDARGQLRA